MMPNSPEHIRTSLAAAMTLDLRDGLFWRDARLYCINLLLVYDKPCAGNCAYCGLHRQRKEPEHTSRSAKALDRPDKTFIRVDWPIFSTKRVIEKPSHSKSGAIFNACVYRCSRAVNVSPIQSKLSACTVNIRTFRFPCSHHRW